jgi:HlyD family secretion protein
MKISKKVLIVAVIMLLAVVAVAVKILSPVKVAYVSPQKRHLVQEVFGTGTVEARVLVTAGSKITGRVKKLYVDQGDFVKKGQLLAVLESDDLQALVKQAVDTQQKSVSMETATKSDLARAQAASRAADAALQKSEATLKLARQTFERYDALFKKGMVSRQDLDEKQAALDESMRQRDNLEAEKLAASADMERVRGTLEAARHDTSAEKASSTYAKAKLDDSYVRASMDGVVVSRDSEEGDAVVPGTSIFRIADPETVWVKSNIDEAQGGGISPGNPAQVYLRSDRKTPLTGSVSRVAQESDRVTEEMEVDVAFPLKDKGRLHLGEQADVYVNGREKDCLSVPIKAVTVREGKEGVFIAAGGKTRFVPIKAGIMAKDFVEIAEGLKESDKVILLDDKLNAELKEGARVKLIQSASGSGKK